MGLVYTIRVCGLACVRFHRAWNCSSLIAANPNLAAYQQTIIRTCGCLLTPIDCALGRLPLRLVLLYVALALSTSADRINNTLHTPSLQELATEPETTRPFEERGCTHHYSAPLRAKRRKSKHENELVTQL